MSIAPNRDQEGAPVSVREPCAEHDGRKENEGDVRDDVVRETPLSGGDDRGNAHR